VEFDTASGVPPAPISARGPTTRLRGLVKAPGNFAPDCVAQLSTAPRGRSLLCPAVLARPEVATVTAKAIATAVLAIAVADRVLIDQRYTGRSAAVPRLSTCREDHPLLDTHPYRQLARALEAQECSLCECSLMPDG
jgi:hypothetical protein